MPAEENAKCLARFVGAAAVPFLASAIGLALGPFGSAAVGATAGAASAAGEEVRKRRHRKRVERLESLVSDVEERVRGLEANEAPPERIDLFVEVVEKAVADEEDLKRPFYAAVLEWMIKKQPPPHEVRLLSDSVKTLSYLELYAMVDETVHRGRNSRDLIRSVLGETFYVSRLAQFGLSHEGVRHTEHPPPLARVLIDRVDLDSLPQPSK